VRRTERVALLLSMVAIATTCSDRENAVSTTREAEVSSSRPESDAIDDDGVVTLVSALEGRKWIVVELEIASGTSSPPDPDAVSVRPLGIDSLQGSGGCNEFSTNRSTVVGYTFEIESTVIGCSAEVGEFETAFFLALAATTEGRREGEVLVLSGDDVTLTFRPAPAG
jgi:heat shock protein HslJ